MAWRKTNKLIHLQSVTQERRLERCFKRKLLEGSTAVIFVEGRSFVLEMPVLFSIDKNR